MSRGKMLNPSPAIHRAHTNLTWVTDPKDGKKDPNNKRLRGDARKVFQPWHWVKITLMVKLKIEKLDLIKIKDITKRIKKN